MLPALFAHRIRAGMPLLILLLGALASATIDDGAAPQGLPGRQLPPLATAELRVTLGRAALSVAGTSASPDHETAIRARVHELFPESRTELQFVPGIVTPAHWAATSTALLELLPLAQSAGLLLDTDGVVFDAVSVEAAQLETELAKLRDALPPGLAVTAHVTAIEIGAGQADPCRQMFAAVAAAPIEFAPASAELRPASFGALDRLVEFGWECPDTRLRVTGHTDSVGEADSNTALSSSRARAVADYLVARGVAAERIDVEGRGDTEPLGDNSTEFGRALNRRIEFALL